MAHDWKKYARKGAMGKLGRVVAGDVLRFNNPNLKDVGRMDWNIDGHTTVRRTWRDEVRNVYVTCGKFGHEMIGDLRYPDRVVVAV